VGSVGGVVAILSGVVLSAVVGDSVRSSAAATNDLGDETSSEWGQVGEDEVAVWVWWNLVQLWRLTEVVERHGSHDRDDNVIVGKVGVERTTEREIGGVVVKGAVDGGV